MNIRLLPVDTIDLIIIYFLDFKSIYHLGLSTSYFANVLLGQKLAFIHENILKIQFKKLKAMNTNEHERSIWHKIFMNNDDVRHINGLKSQLELIKNAYPGYGRIRDYADAISFPLNIFLLLINGQNKKEKMSKLAFSFL
jgi:hypothetical protein